MSKSICLAALLAVSLATHHAQAQPRPRFSTRLPAPAPVVPAPGAAVQTTAAAQPAAVEVDAKAAVEAETPRAAPLGAVQAAPLAAVAQPAPEPVVEPQPAPAEPAPSAPAPAASGLTHVVASGDTIYAIGRRYGVGPQAIASLNGLTFDSTLRVGQRVALPAGAVDKGPAAAFPGRLATTARIEPPAAAQPKPEVSAARTVVIPPPRAPRPPVATPAPVPAAPPRATPVVPAPTVTPPSRGGIPVIAADAARRPVDPAAAAAPGAAVPPAATARPSFAWPLQGSLLAPFGPTGVGRRNDGVRIAAPEGAPVRAAAAGRVVYAGDQVKGGYGKLVLVEHADRWFTAYAHLGEIRVRMQDRVSAGQELGSVGRTGSVASPQLYFEVRNAPSLNERARPVDPIPLLPQP